MSYDTLYFAVYLAIVWCLFSVLPWRGWILLTASIAFYAVAGPRDTMLATLIILANYVSQFPVAEGRRGALTTALIFNIGCLAYFKYRAFFSTAAGFNWTGADVVIPLGISFYVFQLSAYLIDIYRGKAEIFRSLPQFALFKLFFGQLVAGPIMRWRQLGPQISALFEGKLPTTRWLGLGLALCSLGLIKKIVFADSLAQIANTIFQQGPATAAAAWVGLWTFAFQIYFDFSGYSDIALGLGFLFGLKLSLNFRQPYLAQSPQEFWQRWHITLSRWIRDYLYIPLGGNHGAAARSALVLIFVMALAGLWHGANSTFVIWGIGWAVVILLWRWCRLPRTGAFAGVLTLFTAVVLWTFFRAPDCPSAMAYLSALAGHPSGVASVPDHGMMGVLVLTGCASLWILHWAESYLFTRRFLRALLKSDGPFLRGIFIAASLWLLVMPKLQNNPFIYFRF